MHSAKANILNPKTAEATGCCIRCCYYKSPVQRQKIMSSLDFTNSVLACYNLMMFPHCLHYFQFFLEIFSKLAPNIEREKKYNTRASSASSSQSEAELSGVGSNFGDVLEKRATIVDLENSPGHVERSHYKL